MYDSSHSKPFKKKKKKKRRSTHTLPLEQLFLQLLLSLQSGCVTEKYWMYTITYKVILGLGFVRLGMNIVIRKVVHEKVTKPYAGSALDVHDLDEPRHNIRETFSTGKFPSPFSYLLSL